MAAEPSPISHSILRAPLLVTLAVVALAAIGCGRARTKAQGLDAQTAPRVLDYRNGWFHMASGSETVLSVAELYMRSPALVAELNSATPESMPAVGTALYIPPHHDRRSLRALLTRVRLYPESVPRTPPPLSLHSSRTGSQRRSRLPISAQAGPRSDVAPETIRPGAPPRADGPSFRWPLRGELLRRFSTRPRSSYGGIAIGAPAGTPVTASRSGAVIYAGSLKGYGNVVVIDHGEGFSSVYGFNKQLLVGNNDRVAAGDRIAIVGRPSRYASERLFFQIRKDARPIDPAPFLD